MRISLVERIAAPAPQVFALFTDLTNAPGRLHAIRQVELLTPGPVGLGTRFRETRLMLGTEQTEEREIIDFEPPRRYRLLSVYCGTEHDTNFRFISIEGGTQVEQDYTARPVSLMAKMLAPLGMLMLSPMRQTLQQELRDLKQIAERHARPR